jgi:cell division protein FtsI (penicillin-binding protein 3)
VRSGQDDGPGSRGGPRAGGRPPAGDGPRRPPTARRTRDGAAPRPGSWTERAQRPGPGRRPAAAGGPAGPRPPLRRGPARRPTLALGNPRRRVRISMLCVGFVLSLIAGRLIQVQAVENGYYRTRADSLRLRTTPVPAMRGAITTADGSTLAMTVQVDQVTADPPTIIAAKSTLPRVASAVAGALGMTPAAVLAKLQHPTSPQYVLLKQGVPAAAAARLSALGEPGITLTPSYARIYPNGSLAANVVGFTNSDAAGDLTGEAGIEQSWNRLLAGRDGQQETQIGTNGQPIPVSGQTTRPMVAGSGIRLTILSSLQWEAEQACAQRVRQTRADSCTVVVMQPSTGKILALAQAPSYDPQHPASLASTVDMPVTNVFDPGSTAKVITVAAALEHGGQTPNSTYTVPYQIRWHGFTYHDADYHPVEHLTVAGILVQSSNVGMVQVDQHVSPQVQHDYFRKFGIGTAAPAGLPAESDGILYPPGKWADLRYTMAFGQGVAVTAVQMASVYATIANGGVRVDPSIVAGTTSPSGHFGPAARPGRQRVIQASTARELMAMLQQVPYLDAVNGAEPWGLIPGYSVASKTGTAQIADPKQGGCLCLYGSSYIGVAPAGDPQLVVAVNVQNPRKGGYYGSEVAGPVFGKVMKFALTALHIPPEGGKRPNVRLTAP